MIKAFQFFLFVWIIITAMIVLFNSFSTREKISTVKSIAFGGFTAALTTLIIVLLYLLF